MATLKIEIAPFQTPNFARMKMLPGERQDGFRESQAIPLKDLSEEALTDLCRAWLCEVYDKAGKSYNWRFD